MSGISLNYKVRTREARNGFLALATADRRELLDEIGSQVLTWMLLNFDGEKTPDGTQWEPSARAREAGGKTLQDKGHLRDSYTYQVDLASESVEVGSNMIYAAIHHFGGKTKPHVIKPKNKKALAFGGVVVKQVNHPGSNIPSRAALGLTQHDEAEIGEIVIDFYREVLARGSKA